MKDKKISIATIAWARNDDEEKLLQSSLQQLAALHLPVFISDGGSSESFLYFLKNIPHFTVLQAKGLWPQAKASITQAGKSGANSILYTEPDKEDFFKYHLSTLLSTVPEEDAGVILASRSAKGFSSFPSFQQMTETAINNCCKEVIGKEMDYCYGPFLFNSQLIPYLHNLDGTCGWGWRPYLFAIAHRLGYKIENYKGDFMCPPDQREDDATERIYRMKQLTENINGIVQASKAELSKTK